MSESDENEIEQIIRNISPEDALELLKDMQDDPDFIILDADSEFDAIRLCSEVIYTVRRGKIIAKVEPAKRTFHGDGEERQVDFKI